MRVATHSGYAVFAPPSAAGHGRVAVGKDGACAGPSVSGPWNGIPRGMGVLYGNRCKTKKAPQNQS